jgi:hypothetical protein
VSLTPLTTKKVYFISKYLCKYEDMSKMALSQRSGAQMKLFDEKTGGQKYCDKAPSKLKFIETDIIELF